MIEVENLTKHYGDRVAVDDISFSVEPGEIIGFLGPNGAGKSTTLRMLTGYLQPTAGRISVGGVDAVADPVRARRALGYMPESVPLYRELRVEEYLRYRAKLKGVARRDIPKRVDQALELANVNDVRRHIIGHLSKGYRSRVGLADALVADPPLLVLDEPTAGLDPNQIRQVRDLIRGMAGKKTVLLSTHILPEVESTCGRVVIINRGQLVGEGAPDELRVASEGQQIVTVEARGERSVVEAALVAAEQVDRVLDVSTLEDRGPLCRYRLEAHGEDAPEAVFRAVAEAGLSLRELRRGQASLEDVFTRLTTSEELGEASDDEDAAAEGPSREDAAAEDPPGEDAASDDGGETARQPSDGEAEEGKS